MPAARSLHRRHESIQGKLAEATGRFIEGSAYQANDIAALRWVYAHPVDSALLAYELVLPRLTEPEREQYYRESQTMAALFGIPRDCLPPDWPSFQRYFTAALQSHTVGVSSGARQLAQTTAGGGRTGDAAALLVQSVDHSICFLSVCATNFSWFTQSGKQHAAERAMRWLRRIYPGLPTALRFVGPYDEVVSGLRGKPRPSLAVRLSNQLWIGQASLFSLSRRDSAGS